MEIVYYEAFRDPRDHPPAGLEEKIIEPGELGFKSGRGFHDYPDPEFSRPQFLPG
jgi:3-hydroxybutyryl-CoA dehydrogenase